MGENNYKWNNWQRINLKNIQVDNAAQYQKNKQANQNMGRISKLTFLQRRHADSQQTHEKKLNIAHYGRIANESYNKIFIYNDQN